MQCTCLDLLAARPQFGAFHLTEVPKKNGSIPPTGSFSRLVEGHYQILRRIAAGAIRDRAYPEQMSPTSLVAETVIRLMAQRNKPQSEDHLRGLATVFMTRVLADASRNRRAQRRGSGKAPKDVSDPSVELDLATRNDPSRGRSPIRTLIDTDELLSALEEHARTMPVQMEVVTLHLIAGIPMPRVAALTEMSERSAYRALEEGRQALAQHLRKRWG